MNLKKYLLLLTLVCSVLLAGCQFQGIWPQTYDGIPVNNNAEANRIFHETGELTSYDQELRYPYMDSTDILLMPEAESEEDYVFEAGEYVVGEEIDPGTYIAFMETVDGTESAAIVVTDREGVRILELSLEGAAHLILLEGYTLEIVSSRNEVVLRPVDTEIDRFTSEESGHVMQGHHIVGETLPGGTYSLLSLEMMLMRSDGTPQVFINANTEISGMTMDMMMMQTQGMYYHDGTIQEEVEEEPVEPILVELNDGDVVINERGLFMELVE